MGLQDYSSQYFFSYRSTSGVSTNSTGITHAAVPQWLKLVLSGTTVTAYQSADAYPGAEAWVQVGAPGNVALTSTFYAGLALSSNSTTATCTGTFDDFAIYTPPVLNVPANMTIQAPAVTAPRPHSWYRGPAMWTAALTGVGTPPSGSIFPLGVTPVTATVTDSAGDVTSGTFTVTVQDTTPPVITVPSNITAIATTASGGYVSYTTTAVDIVSGTVSTINVPPSGSFFPGWHDNCHNNGHGRGRQYGKRDIHRHHAAHAPVDHEHP